MPFCRSYILWFLSCCVQTSSSSFTHRHFLSFFLHTLTLSKRQFLNHAADYKPWTQPDHNIYHRMRRLKLGIMFYVLNLISNQLQPRPHYCAEVCAASTHTHTYSLTHTRLRLQLTELTPAWIQFFLTQSPALKNLSEAPYAAGPRSVEIFSAPWDHKGEITDFSLLRELKRHVRLALSLYAVRFFFLFLRRYSMSPTWISKYLKMLIIHCVSLLNSRLGAICHNYS